MAEAKKLHGRGGMVVDEKLTNRVLGYWPEHLKNVADTSPAGWVAQAYRSYRNLLEIAQPLNDQNLAIAKAKQTNRPLPELPEPQVREKRARESLKRLEKIQADLVKTQDEALKQSMSLKAFELPNDMASVMLRQERRAHLKTLTGEQKREALRMEEFRAAASEQLPSISGLLPTEHKTIIDEEMRKRYPSELQGLSEAQEALSISGTVFETTRLALENEIKASGAQLNPAPPPTSSKPWIEE